MHPKKLRDTNLEENLRKYDLLKLQGTALHVVAFNNQFIYIFGGYSTEESNPVSSIERIDLDCLLPRAWVYPIAQKIPPGSLITTFSDKKLLILGGSPLGQDQIISFFDVLDGSADTIDASEYFKNKHLPEVFCFQSDHIIKETQTGKTLFFISTTSQSDELVEIDMMNIEDHLEGIKFLSSVLPQSRQHKFSQNLQS